MASESVRANFKFQKCNYSSAIMNLTTKELGSVERGKRRKLTFDKFFEFRGTK